MDWSGFTDKPMLVARVGRIQGTHVYCRDRSADSEGYPIDIVYEIPEPATLALVGMGVVGLFGYVRRQRKK